MGNTWQRAIVALLLSAAGVGCGDSKDSGGGADGGGDQHDAWQLIETLSDDLNRYLSAICAYNVRCASDSFANCRDESQGVFCEAGLQTVKLPELEACEKAIEQAPCNVIVVKECYPARKALRDTRGAYALVTEGESCDGVTRRCDFLYYCSAQPGQCGQCSKLPEQGEACTPDNRCGSGLFCAADGHCSALLAEGKTCDEQNDGCDVGFHCDHSKCVPVHYALDGDACKSDDDCGSTFCVAGKCSAAAECGQGKKGAPCHYTPGCLQGLICDNATQRCAEPIADGSTCDPQHHQCKSTSYCDPESSKCTARVEEGGACPYTQQLSDSCTTGFCTIEQKCGLPACTK